MAFRYRGVSGTTPTPCRGAPSPPLTHPAPGRCAWVTGNAPTPSGPPPGWDPKARTFRATLGFGDRIETVTATATGPVAALTEMLYEQGIAVEMLGFHQLRSEQNVATFIRGSDGARAEWAMGWSDDATQSALRAVIACANRLYAWPGRARRSVKAGAT